MHFADNGHPNTPITQKRTCEFTCPATCSGAHGLSAAKDLVRDLASCAADPCSHHCHHRAFTVGMIVPALTPFGSQECTESGLRYLTQHLLLESILGTGAFCLLYDYVPVLLVLSCLWSWSCQDDDSPLDIIMFRTSSKTSLSSTLFGT